MAGPGGGTADKPWTLKTPPGTSEYDVWTEDAALVVQVGKTGVAVIADTFYNAKTAVAALPVTWEEGVGWNASSATIAEIGKYSRYAAASPPGTCVNV